MPWNRPFHVINYFKLLHHRNNKECNDVYDLDHRIDRRTSSVLVRIADCITCDGGLVPFASLLMKNTLGVGNAVFKGFLGVIPGAAAAGHGDGLE